MASDKLPFLRQVSTIQNPVDPEVFPFSIPALRAGISLTFDRNVTFFVGENGTGKSTILEAIAAKCGFNLSGGNRNHTYDGTGTDSSLAPWIRLSWRIKVTRGFFMRAESFFNFATYIDQLAGADSSVLESYGGKSLHDQSHGEAFLSLFTNRFNDGIYILDEPEAALSPQRQLAFLALLHDLQLSGRAQFLIATHSPLIFSYPHATVLSLDDHGIAETPYDQTPHFQLVKQFLDAPERYFRHLLDPQPED